MDRDHMPFEGRFSAIAGAEIVTRIDNSQVLTNTLSEENESSFNDIQFVSLSQFDGQENSWRNENQEMEGIPVISVDKWLTRQETIYRFVGM